MKPPQATGAELRLRHAETNTSHAALSSQLQTCFFPYFCHIKHPGPLLLYPLPRTFWALFWFERSVSRPWNGQNPILRQQATWQFLRVSGCLKLDHPGIAAMAAMDIMILLKKDGMPLIVAQLRWNDVQTTVNIWKLIAFDPKGPWKSFRKSHRYRGFVWNPARFDEMHDLVQMVNENYRKKHKITGNMFFFNPILGDNHHFPMVFPWFFHGFPGIPGSSSRSPSVVTPLRPHNGPSPHGAPVSSGDPEARRNISPWIDGISDILYHVYVICI